MEKGSKSIGVVDYGRGNLRSVCKALEAVGASVSLVTEAALKRHVQRLNDTPRKCLDFQTPAEAFSKLKSIVALQT